MVAPLLTGSCCLVSSSSSSSCSSCSSPSSSSSASSSCGTSFSSLTVGGSDGWVTVSDFSSFTPERGREKTGRVGAVAAGAKAEGGDSAAVDETAGAVVRVAAEGAEVASAVTSAGVDVMAFEGTTAAGAVATTVVGKPAWLAVLNVSAFSLSVSLFCLRLLGLSIASGTRGAGVVSGISSPSTLESLLSSPLVASAASTPALDFSPSLSGLPPPPCTL